MKKKMLVVTAVIASAIMLAFGGADSAFAASRTDTAEVLGATRSSEDAGEAAVLGVDRKQNSIEVKSSDITDPKVLSDIENKIILAETINIVNGTNITADELEVLSAFDITVPEGTIIDADNPLFLTFSVPGITSEVKLHVLHYANGSVWEEVTSETGDGYVVGGFTSLSPVTIVAEKSTLSAAANTSKKGTGSATSPRTGDNQIVFVIIFAIIAITCVLATFISLKKEKK